jgi:hypothetical protein
VEKMSKKELLRRKGVSTSLPNFWTPKENGDWIFGECIRITKNPFDETMKAYIVRGITGSSKDEPYYPFDDKQEEYMLPRNVGLMRLFEESNLSPGKLVYAEYIQQRNIGRGRKVKDFIVAVLEKEEAQQLFASQMVLKEKVEEPTVEKVEVKAEEKDQKIIEVLKDIVSYYGNEVTKDRFIYLLKKKGIEYDENELTNLGLIEPAGKVVKIKV